MTQVLVIYLSRDVYLLLLKPRQMDDQSVCHLFIQRYLPILNYFWNQERWMIRLLAIYLSRNVYLLVWKPRKMDDQSASHLSIQRCLPISFETKKDGWPECLSSIYPEMFTYLKSLLKPRKMDDQGACHLSIQRRLLITFETKKDGWPECL